MIIGTAGHIDHGKTELIRALTGIETDRLREEKERGISIDIGFAWLEIAGRRIGVVDVPGHERFIRNMLAGAHGVDLVLLVVAADDGVMPQTEEHLDIVHLLGTERGIVVITKIDLVPEKRRSEVREEIEILVDGTALEGAQVIEVSSLTGEGIDVLRTAVQAEIESYQESPARGLFRMPVDRSFSMHGHGTVVTGTASAGGVQSGQHVRVLPGGGEARVRGVQVHGVETPNAERGQRIALNLSGVDVGEVRRGQVICDSALDGVTDRFDAFVELRPSVGRPLRRHSMVRVHVGTAEKMGKILYLDGRDELAAKETAYVQLALREPIAAFGGDRFILREQTARGTIGGGLVLYPFAERPRRRKDPRLAALQEVHRAKTPQDQMRALMSLQRTPVVTTDTLAAAANLRGRDIHRALAKHAGIYRFPDNDQADAYATHERWAELRDDVTGLLEVFHASEPNQDGMEVESLHSRCLPETPVKIFRVIVAKLVADGVLARDGSCVRLPRHKVEIDDPLRQHADQLMRRLDESEFQPPSIDDLARDLGMNGAKMELCLGHLEKEGRARRVDAKLVYSEAVLERVREVVRQHTKTHGEIDARTLRDLIGASRKFSIALLTYFDRSGFTMRVGDIRKLRG